MQQIKDQITVGQKVEHSLLVLIYSINMLRSDQID